jgi:hypothetical protein
MRFFVVFIQVKDFESARSTLINFKKSMQDQGEVQVIDTIQDTYDYLLNSLIERANQIKKGR